MKPELYWLALTATMTALFWIPYILNRAMRRGVPGAFLTPLMEAAPVEAEWAQRAKRAHSNAVENLVVFTALIATAASRHQQPDNRFRCCALFLGAPGPLRRPHARHPLRAHGHLDGFLGRRDDHRLAGAHALTPRLERMRYCF